MEQTSHHVLSYHDTSDNAGVGGDVLTIHISHDLQLHTTYYYNVSLVAVDGNISARVLHSFRIVHTTCIFVSNLNCFMYASTNYSNCIVFGV